MTRYAERALVERQRRDDQRRAPAERPQHRRDQVAGRQLRAGRRFGGCRAPRSWSYASRISVASSWPGFAARSAIQAPGIASSGSCCGDGAGQRADLLGGQQRRAAGGQRPRQAFGVQPVLGLRALGQIGDHDPGAVPDVLGVGPAVRLRDQRRQQPPAHGRDGALPGGDVVGRRRDVRQQTIQRGGEEAGARAAQLGLERVQDLTLPARPATPCRRPGRSAPAPRADRPPARQQLLDAARARVTAAGAHRCRPAGSVRQPHDRRTTSSVA